MKVLQRSFYELSFDDLLGINGGYSSRSSSAAGSSSGYSSTSGGIYSAWNNNSKGSSIQGGSSGSYGVAVSIGEGGESSYSLISTGVDTASEDDLAKVVNGVSWPVGTESLEDGTAVTSEYGIREGIPGTADSTSGTHFHDGVDIAAESGTRINSVGDGVVVEAGYSEDYGNYIVIKHSSGANSKYGHWEDVSVGVGDTVKAGEQIGTVGSTGNSTGPHLHFGWDGNGDGKYNDPKYDNPSSVLSGGTF